MVLVGCRHGRRENSFQHGCRKDNHFLLERDRKKTIREFQSSVATIPLNLVD